MGFSLIPGPIGGNSSAASGGGVGSSVLSATAVANATKLQVTGLDFLNYDYDISLRLENNAAVSSSYSITANDSTGVLNAALVTLTNTGHSRTFRVALDINRSSGSIYGAYLIEGIGTTTRLAGYTAAVANITSIEVTCTAANMAASMDLVVTQRPRA